MTEPANSEAGSFEKQQPVSLDTTEIVEFCTAQCPMAVLNPLVSLSSVFVGPRETCRCLRETDLPQNLLAQS